MKYTACISDKVNGAEGNVNLFCTVTLCSDLESNRSGIAFDRSVKEARPISRRFYNCTLDLKKH